jgi:hypothetical protein
MSELETFFGRQSGGSLPDQFKNDLAQLLSVSEAARSGLVKNLSRILFVKDDYEKQAAVRELDAKFGKEVAGLDGLLRILVNFAYVFLSDPEDNPAAKDDPEKIAADFRKIAGMYPAGVPNAEKIFSGFLKSVKEAALSMKSDFLKRRIESGVLPVLESFASTVELRGIIEPKYRYTQNVADYKPSPIGFVGIASIRIGLDSGQPKSFTFQASNEELTKLINGLVATQKELYSIEQTIKGNDKITN